MTTAATAPGRRRTALATDFAASVRTILSRELRGRFRGRRAFVVLTLYLAALAVIAYGAYTVQAPQARDLAGGAPVDPGGLAGGVALANASASIGQAIFSLLSVFQLLLVAFIAPAFTAGAISLEREKQTLDLLVTTPMRPGAIVVGKLLAALAFVFLLIVAAIPVSALVLMYGGAGIDDIVRQQIILFVTAIGFGVIGVFYSALVRRTQAATVLTYTTILVIVIGTLLVWRFWTEIATNDPSNQFAEVRRAPEQLLWVNPAVAMIEVVANTELQYGDFTQAMQSIRGGNVVNVPTPVPTKPVGVGVGGGVGGGVAVDCPPNAPPDCRPPAPGSTDTVPTELVSSHFLLRFVISFALLSLLLTVAAMRLVVPAGMRFVFRRRRAVTAASREGAPAVQELEP
jgi:ABC-type transport system involved in multi-copper enzyme maturation permease subunit